MNITLSLEEISDIIHTALKERFESNFSYFDLKIVDNSNIVVNVEFPKQNFCENSVKTFNKFTQNLDFKKEINNQDFSKSRNEEKDQEILEKILQLLITNEENKNVEEILDIYYYTPELVKKILLEKYNFKVFLDTIET